MNKSTNRGARAEQAAAVYLQGQGLQILEMNFRRKTGEIDIICSEKKTVVFVEVRFRRQTRYGFPAETIQGKKQRKLLATAKIYLQLHSPHVQCRFDVMEITLQRTCPGGEQQFAFNWIKNAFDQCW